VTGLLLLASVLWLWQLPRTFKAPAFSARIKVPAWATPRLAAPALHCRWRPFECLSERYRSRLQSASKPTTEEGKEAFTDAEMSELGQRISSLRALEVAAWHEVPIQGQSPTARMWHSLTEVAENDTRLCLFGGQSSVSGSMLSDTWLLEMPRQQGEAAQWTKVNVRGRRPPGRVRHDAAIVHGRWLVIHGGVLENGRRFHDTWRLDLEDAQPSWEQIGGEDSARPVPRCHHTFLKTSTGDIIIFGGHNFAYEALSDAWILKVAGVAEDGARLVPRWQRIGGLFDGPSPRAHQAALMIDRWMIVSGGETQDGGASDEVWALDVPSDMWREVPMSGCTSGRSLGGLMQHMACCIDESTGTFVVCGGQGRSVLDLRSVECLIMQAKCSSNAGGALSCEQLLCQESLGLPPSHHNPRRDGTLLQLPSGHLILFGGNEGELAEGSGEDFRECGCGETLIAHAANSVSQWQCVSNGAPETTAFGCAVAKLDSTRQVVVVDSINTTIPWNPDVVRVHALSMN